MHQKHTTGVRRRRLGAVVAAVGASALLAACGSADSDSSSKAAAAPSTTTSGSGVSAEATAAYNAALKPPTTFSGPTTPVPAKRGLKVGLLACDAKLTGCTTMLKDMQSIVQKELGWSTKFYDGQSDPKAWNQDLLQMVADHVDVIATSGLPPALVGQGLAAAKKAHIPVVTSSGGGGTPNPTVPSSYFSATDIDYAKAGAASAAYMTVQSKGKGSVLVLGDESQIAVKTHTDQFKSSLKQLCPGCKQASMATSTADVTTSTPTQVTGYLRAHPDVDWLYVGYDPQAAFIVPALQKAGLSKIKLMGILGNPQNVEFVKSGAIQVSDIMIDLNYYGWAMTDQLLRAVAGQDPAEPNGEGTPWYLVTKEAGNAPKDAEDWVAPYDYPATFRKLWGIG
jgi:ribose transport system substrate-binding protein